MATANAISAFGEYFKAEGFTINIPYVGNFYPGMTVPECLRALNSQCKRQLLRIHNDKPNLITYKDRYGIYLRFTYSGAYIIGIEYKNIQSLVPDSWKVKTEKYVYLTNIVCEGTMLRFISDNQIILKKATESNTTVLPPYTDIQRPSKDFAQTIQSLFSVQEKQDTYISDRLPVLENDVTAGVMLDEVERLKKQISELEENLKISKETETELHWQRNIILEMKEKLKNHSEEVDTALARYNNEVPSYFNERYLEYGLIYKNDHGFFRLNTDSSSTKDRDYSSAKSYITRVSQLEYEYWEVVRKKDTYINRLHKAEESVEQLRDKLSKIGTEHQIEEELLRIRTKISDIQFNVTTGVNATQ